jgi:hypothetical protein
VLGGAGDLRGLEAIGRFLALGGRRSGDVTDLPPATLFDAHETHLVPMPEGLTADGLRHWLGDLHRRLPGLLVRAKGIAVTTDLGPVLVQVVGLRQEVGALPSPERAPATDLVAITIEGPDE